MVGRHEKRNGYANGQSERDTNLSIKVVQLEIMRDSVRLATSNGLMTTHPMDSICVLN